MFNIQLFIGEILLPGLHVGNNNGCFARDGDTGVHFDNIIMRDYALAACWNSVELWESFNQTVLTDIKKFLI